jgi:hypothetical protein
MTGRRNSLPPNELLTSARPKTFVGEAYRLYREI